MVTRIYFYALNISPMYNSQNDNDQNALEDNLAVVQLREGEREREEAPSWQDSIILQVCKIGKVTLFPDSQFHHQWNKYRYCYMITMFSASSY